MSTEANHMEADDSGLSPSLVANRSLYSRWAIMGIAVIVVAITWVNVLFPWQQFEPGGRHFGVLLFGLLVTAAGAYAIYHALDKGPQLSINYKGLYHKQWLISKKMYRFVPWENVWYYHFSYEGDDKKLYLNIKTKNENLIKIPVHGLDTDEVALMQIFEHYAARYHFQFLAQ